MSKLEIPKNEHCPHESVFEYVHDVCGNDDCAVDECNDCGLFATECEMEKQ